jgi:hypothetical protein
MILPISFAHWLTPFFLKRGNKEEKKKKEKNFGRSGSGILYFETPATVPPLI